MPAGDTYLTVNALSKGTFRDRGSKFIALACPVVSEEDIKEQLSDIRKEYHDAHHHCYAFRLGKEPETYRVNDDGEPSGSAGKPIFNQILSKGLTNILVVVVRYFGGTKLGIPGLVRAYKTASREALDHADIVERTLESRISATFGYDSMNGVMKVLKEEHAAILGQTSDNRCTVSFSIRMSRREFILSRLKKISGIEIGSS